MQLNIWEALLSNARNNDMYIYMCADGEQKFKLVFTFACRVNPLGCAFSEGLYYSARIVFVVIQAGHTFVPRRGVSNLRWVPVVVLSTHGFEARSDAFKGPSHRRSLRRGRIRVRVKLRVRLGIPRGGRQIQSLRIFLTPLQELICIG